MMKFTEDQLQVMESAGTSPEAVEAHWNVFPELQFVNAVSAVADFNKGLGQKRTERFNDEEFEPSSDFLKATEVDELVAVEEVSAESLESSDETSE